MNQGIFALIRSNNVYLLFLNFRSICKAIFLLTRTIDILHNIRQKIWFFEKNAMNILLLI